MNDFERQFWRYVVLKQNDIEAALTPKERNRLHQLCKKVADKRKEAGKPVFKCVVVEEDWPEYEPTWQAIQERCEKKSDWVFPYQPRGSE